MRRLAVPALALALAACTHGPSTSARIASAGKPRAISTPVGQPAPLARMQTGTDEEPGAVLAWCAGSTCERHAATPQRYLIGDANGVLIFMTPTVPLAATVVLRTPAGREVAHGSLTPGTTMAFATALPRGRYVVALAASWRAAQGRWLFGVKGPFGQTP